MNRQLLAALVIGAAMQGFAQPSLPKEKIPANAPPDVRAQIERMYSSEPASRVDAATTLGEMGANASAAIPFLIDVLRENSGMVSLPRKLTARYMPPGTITLMSGDTVMDFESLSAQIALARIGEPALKRLVAAARDKDEAIRYGAVRALGHMRVAGATEALAQLFDDASYGEREIVVRALGDRRDPTAVEILKKALEDRNPEVKKAAQTALEKAKSAR